MEEPTGWTTARSGAALPQVSTIDSPLLSCVTTENGQKSIQHKALPNAEIIVLPQDNKVNVVAVVVVVRLLIA